MTEAGQDSKVGEIAHAAVRGAVGAMAMSGMRSFTVTLGLVEEEPPRAMLRQVVLGRLGFHAEKRRRRRAAQELAHWGYGAVGGAVFGALPDGIRLQPWAGPAYGVVVWLGFELGLAPVLGLEQARKPRPVDRAALAVDHVLYGLVLGELRRRPQD